MWNVKGPQRVGSCEPRMHVIVHRKSVSVIPHSSEMDNISGAGLAAPELPPAPS